MFCINCGKQITENSLFCPYCGAKIQSGSFANNTNNTVPPYHTGISNTSSLPSGILLVWIGLIIEIAAQIPHFISSGITGSATTVYLWLTIGGAVVMLIGLFQLAPLNRFFAKARMYCIAFIIESVVMGLIMMIVAASATMSIYYGSYAGIYGLIAVDIIYFVISLFLDLLMIKMIIEGFAALAEGNQYLSTKCRSVYFHYMLSKVLICAFSVIALFITIGWMTSGSGYSAIFAMAVILLMCYIYSAVALALIVYRLYPIVKQYKYMTITANNTPPVSDLIQDLRDDMRQIWQK